MSNPQQANEKNRVFLTNSEDIAFTWNRVNRTMRFRDLGVGLEARRHDLDEMQNPHQIQIHRISQMCVHDRRFRSEA
jgi:hypothetical protein